jgi:hypothetical protein
MVGDGFMCAATTVTTKRQTQQETGKAPDASPQRPAAPVASDRSTLQSEATQAIST